VTLYVVLTAKLRGRERTTIPQRLLLWLHLAVGRVLAAKKCENEKLRLASGSAAWNMPSTHKKVVVRKLNRDTLNGFVSPADFIS